MKNYFYKKDSTNLLSRWIVYACFITLSILTSNVMAVPLAGTKDVGGGANDYATLDLAITDLNTQGVGGAGVTFNVFANQTAPAGGYVIGGATSLIISNTSATPIVINGANFTVTAFAGQTVGSVNDAIFKIIGADFVTIQNFTMAENAGNTVSATAATNNMTEFGVALFYVTVTNGSQNNTIQNNTISLNRTYRNTFGVYSSARHSSTDMLTAANATAASGSNSNNKVYGNNISNVAYGVVLLGAGVAAAMDSGNDIGGTSASTGNTITNWSGGAATLTAYNSLTVSSYCIFVNHQINDNVSYNVITSPTLAQSNSVGGILKNFSAALPTGTITTTINNNTVSVSNNPTAATTGTIFAINSQGLTTLLSTATININNNTMQNCVLGGSTSTTNPLFGIISFSLSGILNISGNTVTNCSTGATTATTGGFTGITNQGAATTVNMNGNFIINCSVNTGTSALLKCIENIAASGTLNINSNTIRGLATSATTGQIQTILNTGAVTTAINMNSNSFGDATGGWFSATSSTPTGGLLGAINVGGTATCDVSMQSNDFRGVVYSALSTAFNTYIYSSVSAPKSFNISFNTFTNLNVNTSGGITFMRHDLAHSSTSVTNMNSNSIVGTFVKAAGATVDIRTATAIATPAGATVNFKDNIFSNMTFSGTTAFNGFFDDDGGAPTKTITGNIFNNISGGTGQIVCLFADFCGNLSTISNNTISNITSQGAIFPITLGTNGVSTTQTCANNTISNIVSNGVGGSITGIACTALATTTNVNNNSISTLSSTGASPVTGILAGFTGATGNVFKNTICDLSGSNAASTVTGILVSAGTTINVTNNRIGDLRTPAANAANPLNGISVTGGTTVNAFYNTVRINATSSGATFGSSAISVATASTVTLNNNIFVNTSTNTLPGLAVAYRRSDATLGTYGGTSNRNDFFASTLYTDGTNTFTSLGPGGGTYKNFVAARDANSITENPPFLSTVCGNANFLKISTAIATGVESGGATVGGITDDFEGDARGGTPDVGADEFAGIALPPCAAGFTVGAITGTTLLCTGFGTTLNAPTPSPTASGYSYQWSSSSTSGGPYTTLGTALTQATGNLTSTTYYNVTVSCINGGVPTASTEFTVTVVPLPVVTASPTSANYCSPGTGISITAGGAVSYNWSPVTALTPTAGSLVVATPIVPTTYTVTGTDANGCINTATSLINGGIPTPNLVASALPNNVCFGQTSQLTASFPVAYTLPAPVNTYSFTPGESATLDPMTGATTIIAPPANTTTGAGDDNPVGPQAIGFNFTYNGTVYSDYSVSPDGFVVMGGPGVAQFTNLVTSTTNIPKIYPFWDDQHITFNGSIQALLTGVAGSRILKLQWQTLVPWVAAVTAPFNCTYQLWLYETTNKIEFRYGSMPSVATSASGGLTGGATNFQSISFFPKTVSTTVANNANDLSAGTIPSGTIFTFLPPTPQFTYAWTPSASVVTSTASVTQTTALTTATTFTVTVSNGGCSSTATTSVTVGTALTCSAATATGPFCNNTSFTVAANSSGGGGNKTYSWSVFSTPSNTLFSGPTIGSTTQSFTLPTGDYNIVCTVTDDCTPQGSCTSSLAVSVKNLPAVSVSPTSGLICNPGGSAITLSALGATTYTWNPSAGLSASTGASVSANPSANTGYTVTGTDGFGCVNTATASITLGNAVSICSISASPTSVACGGSSTLSVVASAAPTTPYCTMGNITSAAGCADPSFPDEYIQNVTFGTINNSSVCSSPIGYQDYTSLSTNLLPGPATTLSATIGNFYVGEDKVTVWVDFNRNNDFTDPGEEFVATEAGAVWSVNITVPGSASNGITRMRVRLTYLSTPVPCGTSGYGEVEDYTINISGASCTSSSGLNYTWTPSNELSSSTGNPVTATPTSSTTWTVVASGADGCSASGTVTVTQGSVLDCGTLTVSNSPVCSGTNYTVSATGVSGGGAPYTYLWSDGTNTYASTTSSVSANLSAGTYNWSAKVTDNCGNTCFTSLAVVVLPSPTTPVVITPSSGQICNPGGSPVDLTASGAVSYVWAPDGELTESITVNPSSSTTYTVTGTVANGCTSSATAFVQVGTYPDLTSTATDENVCAGVNTTLNASVIIPVSYLYCAIEDNVLAFDCNSATQPNPYIDNVTFGTINNTSVCSADVYTDYTSQSTNVSPGPTYALDVTLGVAYTVSVITAYIDFNQDGDFFDLGETFTLTSTNQFDWTTNVVVPPTAINGNTRMRIRHSFTLEAASPCGGMTYPSETEDYTINISGATNASPQVSYSWAPTANVNNSTLQNPQTKDLITGSTTTFTVTATYKGCSATSTVSVISGEELICSDATVSAGAICDGSTFTVTAHHAGGGQPYTITWTDGNGGNYSGESIYPNLGAGSYQFDAIVLDGCGSTCTSSILIVVNPLPIASISPGGLLCSDDLPIELTADETAGVSGPLTYQWKKDGTNIPAATLSTYTVTTAGSYTVVITSGDGCPDESDPAVVYSSPNAIVVTPTSSSISCGGNTDITASSPYSGSFTSTTVITIPASGLSTPFPGTVAVSGVPAGAVLTSVNLNGFSHDFPDDVVIMLQSPTGTYVYLMAGNGSTSAVTGIDLVIQDGGGTYTDPMVNGTYAPFSSYAGIIWPSPIGTVSTTPATLSLGTYTGENMNGTWNLFSGDLSNPDGGELLSWTLNFTSTVDPSVTYTWSPSAGLNTSLGSSVSASPSATTEYTVTATNASGCTSTATSTVTVTGSCGVPLYLKLFIEGYYIGGGQMNPCLYLNEQAATLPGLPFPQGPYALTDCDYIDISAMDATDGSFLESQTGLLQTDGTVNVNFTTLSASTSYYIRLIHRNALEIWSSLPVDFSATTSLLPYDFTTDITQAYSVDGYVTLPQHQMTDGPWAILSGDMGSLAGSGLQDGNIDLLDFNYWDTDNAAFNYGYLVGDLNGDVNVNLYDFNYWDTNNAAFEYVQRPF